MSNLKRATGGGGEDLAVAYLERQGWSILARNWRCREGEIDIVARDPSGAVAVCEVKCRRGLGFGAPLEAVTYAKVRRLRRLAAAWAAAQPVRVGVLRVDAIGVLLHADGTATVTHVRGVEP